MEEVPATLLFVSVVAVLAPIIAAAPLPMRLPMVVLEIVLGMAIGPQGLNLAQVRPGVQVFGELGLSFLFMLAGIEIDFAKLKGPPLNLASKAWAVSLVLAVAFGFVGYFTHFIEAPILVALALTTTAIGTLMPIVSGAGLLQTRFGVLFLGAGAAGEFGPVLCISLVAAALGGGLKSGALLVGFVALAVVAIFLSTRAEAPRFAKWLGDRFAKEQLLVRVAVLLLAIFLFLSALFGVDLVLGAFSAGLVLGLLTKSERGHHLRERLEDVGFGFLIPIFFISVGMKFDLKALFGNPQALMRVPLFLAMFLVVRGLPTFLYGKELEKGQKLPFALLASTALPLVVAVVELGHRSGRMHSENALALVGAAMLSVLLFPAIALGMLKRAPPQPLAGSPAAH
ncbi:MAG: cation:proton antiporter [Myxococcales bacterium]|nr:cation:proton antiporter [Myxococcales bacterium]